MLKLPLLSVSTLAASQQHSFRQLSLLEAGRSGRRRFLGVIGSVWNLGEMRAHLLFRALHRLADALIKRLRAITLHEFAKRQVRNT